MNKILKTSMFYTIFGLLSGVYYREFTKINGFTDKTQLSVLHTHSLILGCVFFILVLLLEKNFQLTKQISYKKFSMFYHAGLGLTLIMMLVRGTLTVLGHGPSGMLAGFAGIGHIILAVGFFFFFKTLFQAIKPFETTA